MIVFGAVSLAIAIVALDANFKMEFVENWPLFFGAGADGARGLLSAVASSMITVAGVVFSITIVALSLTSSHTHRECSATLCEIASTRWFLGLSRNLCVLPGFLRTVRGGDEGAFVPSLAVLGGLLLAFVGIAFLIYFIHHIALSIQAASIIAAVSLETMKAIDQLFPDRLGKDSQLTGDELSSDQTREWISVQSMFTGYIESVDGNSLLDFAIDNDTVVRMERGVGEFVVEGTPLVSVPILYRLRTK